MQLFQITIICFYSLILLSYKYYTIISQWLYNAQISKIKTTFLVFLISSYFANCLNIEIICKK